MADSNAGICQPSFWKKPMREDRRPPIGDPLTARPMRTPWPLTFRRLNRSRAVCYNGETGKDEEKNMIRKLLCLDDKAFYNRMLAIALPIALQNL
ncbi:MAG: hypothetical protein RR320_01755, partial [Oscillospiraceae bacterium]